jgi:hypothetical protein
MCIQLDRDMLCCDSIGCCCLQPLSARAQAGLVLMWPKGKISFWLESEHDGKGLDAWVTEPDREWLR